MTNRWFPLRCLKREVSTSEIPDSGSDAQRHPAPRPSLHARGRFWALHGAAARSRSLCTPGRTQTPRAGTALLKGREQGGAARWQPPADV